ncbi:hydrolase [Legionella quinlivanii]|uniref:Hydrolase n=1 Tax=Legionella quinlivanii TaxID=45073 RepID=A0A364LM51_9GAMM|nr:dienelactone hydrolase family protein [Legionella quinlivanii]RAP37608.1 hydrolase [Legionella quinlivanii]
MNNFLRNKMHTIRIPSGNACLDGILFIPESAKSIVLFAHGSGSSRLSSRNHFVARSLNNMGHATLLFDLLTPKEEAIDSFTREIRFNISLLASRLIDAKRWCQQTLDPMPSGIGYFGASTGAGAAIEAAVRDPDQVKAIVSRGGRPDLALAYLQDLKAPTLLIVGGYDSTVIKFNQDAKMKMNSHAELQIIAGANHLFEESGKLEEVSHLANSWFNDYLL